MEPTEGNLYDTLQMPMSWGVAASPAVAEEAEDTDAKEEQAGRFGDGNGTINSNFI